MGAVYRITDLARQPEGGLYATVAFWENRAVREAGKPPFLIEDFLIDIGDWRGPIPISDRWGRRLLRDSDEFVFPWTEDPATGEWVPHPGPWRMRPFALRAFVRQNINEALSIIASDMQYEGDRRDRNLMARKLRHDLDDDDKNDLIGSDNEVELEVTRKLPARRRLDSEAQA